MDSMEKKRIRTNPGFLGGTGEVSLEHFLIVLLHRKWLVLGVFLLVSAATAGITYRLPDVFTSETLILVDPQKVPDAYVRSTVTGDIRNRLGTLSQQILSATRLQTVIEKFNLYAEARANKVPREDLINRMRADVRVQVVSDFGASQDLQAFRIAYSGTDPRLVAQVTNELASLFIEENLKAREQQATGTSEFLENQLDQTRRELESQEAKLRDFKLKHIGEMPEQQAANIQMLGQLQAQVQSETDALIRAEQQRGIIQAMMAQSEAPVVDLDPPGGPAGPPQPAVSSTRAQLAELLSRYGERHPDVVLLKKQLEEEEEQKRAQTAATPAPVNTPRAPRPVAGGNPVLQSQLRSLEEEIAKHKQERERLKKIASLYEQRLEAIPVREQAVAELVRDYEITKAHYQSLLDKMLSAETATQLEMRQKGEKFTILDPAQVAEKPSSPNRLLLNAGGSLGGLALGLLLALLPEIFGLSISSAEQIAATGVAVLGVIPVIRTGADRRRRKRWILAGATSGVLSMLAAGAFLVYHFRDRFF